MTQLPFIKMHGLGNDFMVIDATQNPFTLTREQIKSAADRHRGVGFDQLLVVAPSDDRNADFSYLIFNQDGSSAEQCGNGARCIARFIHEKKLSDKQQLKLFTAGKITQVRLENNNLVTVEICEPYFEPDPPYTLDIEGRKIEFYLVNVGNPHAVINVPEIDASEVERVGKKLSMHPNFPQGINVGFMHLLSPEHIQLQVYERGTGMTLACGSGACAAAAVGIKLNQLKTEVQVSQPGGDLWVSWQGKNFPILMRGPAEFVYQGYFFLA